MERSEALQKVLRSYEAYYTVNQTSPEAPFDAEAEFSLHDEQYFLIKSARISEADSKEFVYFSTVERLDADKIRELDRLAWERGTAKVRPHGSHRNSDVVLVILADQIDQDVKKLIPNMRHYKSYKYGFHGWSHYRLVAIELSTGQSVYNRHGRDLRKLVSNIL